MVRRTRPHQKATGWAAGYRIWVAVMMTSQNRRKETGRKAPSSAWRPGHSGNPGGRPKASAEVRDLARHHGREAIERLVALMHSKNESVAVRAAEALLDRGYGRPMHGME